MPNDLIVNYEYLSTFTLKERFIRGIKIIEFYKIEYEIGVIAKTIILDILNMLIFVPFGILITHFIKKKRVVKALLITFIISLIIELFQLYTIIGAFMLNDLLINVIGGLIGSILYIIITKNNKYNVYNILLILFIFIELIIVLYLLINFVVNLNVYGELFNRL
jgi:glycopeptide antibiotics resistance protein